MHALTVPGTYRPQADTQLLADALAALRPRPGARVLEVCAGSGAVAVTAARAGAAVTVTDVSTRAVLSCRLNARRAGVRVRALRGDLFGPVAGERFDVVVANPPYVPADADDVPRRGRRRAWDAGRDGRSLLDRICADAPARLAPGGVLLVVHSSVSGVDETLAALRRSGLDAEVVLRRREPFGPVMHARAALLEDLGLVGRGVREEELVVIRGRRSPVKRPTRVPAEPAARAIARPQPTLATS